MIKYVRADSGVVFLREADERPMTIAAVDGLTMTEESRGSLLELYSRIVPLMDGKPLVLEPLPESARRVLAVDLLGEVRGLACTQLVLKGKALGAICLFSNAGMPLQKQQTALLSTICNQLAVALENARFIWRPKRALHSYRSSTIWVTT